MCECVWAAIVCRKRIKYLEMKVVLKLVCISRLFCGTLGNAVVFSDFTHTLRHTTDRKHINHTDVDHVLFTLFVYLDVKETLMKYRSQMWRESVNLRTLKWVSNYFVASLKIYFFSCCWFSKLRVTFFCANWKHATIHSSISFHCLFLFLTQTHKRTSGIFSMWPKPKREIELWKRERLVVPVHQSCLKFMFTCICMWEHACACWPTSFCI